MLLLLLFFWSKKVFVVVLLLCTSIVAWIVLPQMVTKGGTGQACSACKYQRRKCANDCPLAPYFPADQPETFRNAHRLFGVCNIMKILKQVQPEQKDDAMKSVIFESNMRIKFPVHGCSGIISQLYSQVQQATEELQIVNARLAVCKDQCRYQTTSTPPDYSHIASTSNDSVQLQLLYNNSDVGMSFIPDHFVVNGNNGIGTALAPNDFFVNGNIDRTKVIPVQQEMEVFHDYDDIPFDTLADDKQS